MVVEAHPVANPLSGLAAAREGMQIDALVFERAPQPFDENVVEEPATAIHRDRHAGLSQALRPRPRGELAALIGVEDLRRAATDEGLLKSIDTVDRSIKDLVAKPDCGNGPAEKK